MSIASGADSRVRSSDTSERRSVVRTSELNTPKQPSLVAIRSVSKVYASRNAPVHAVDSVSLDLHQGEFVSVVGPSGCGKSTLLLMLAGLVPPTDGTIAVDGKPVVRPQTGIGIVFQDPVLLEWRTVLGNVLLQGEMRNLDRVQLARRASELLTLVGLEGFTDRYPHELSGGMRQRVSICRALVHDPPLLLMDEPFGALDALSRDQINLDLQSIWLRSQPTVLFVTHSIAEAVFLSDRVVVMSARPGRVERILKVQLPRPRRLSVRDSAAFAACTADIRATFQSLGVLREEASP